MEKKSSFRRKDILYCFDVKNKMQSGDSCAILKNNSGVGTPTRAKQGEMTMEQLLKILEDNARLPIEDIATMLNKSPAEWRL